MLLGILRVITNVLDIYILVIFIHVLLPFSFLFSHSINKHFNLSSSNNIKCTTFIYTSEPKILSHHSCWLFFSGEFKNRIGLCTTRQYCQMAEIRNTYNAATLLNNSEVSHGIHGGYNTADDKLTSHNYITSYPPKQLWHIPNVCAGVNESYWGWWQFKIRIVWCVGPCQFHEGCRKSKVKEYFDEEKKPVILQVDENVDPDLVKMPKVMDDWVNTPPK